MQPPSQPQTATGDHQAHEQQLAAALRELLQQIDVADYRDSQGRALHDRSAFRQAQEIVDRFGLTHEQLCRTLDDCEATDPAEAAHRLVALRTASPADTPPEYDTWHTGP